MITAKTTREMLREHLNHDASLLKDFGEIAAFGAVIAAGTALAPAAFVALIVKTAASAITAGTRVLERLGTTDDAATRQLPSTYERFRVMFYVACQRAFLEAVEDNFKGIEKVAKKHKLDKTALEHARKGVEQSVAQLDEAEVRFRYSLDPTDEPIPLFRAYAEWVSAALVVTMPDYSARSAFVTKVHKEAVKRLHATLAASTAPSEWMRRYLALERASETADAVRSDLGSIRAALDGWLELASGKRQRAEAWKAYREMLQSLPDARETMFNEDFGVRKVFVAPRVTYHRAGTSESGEKPAVVPDLGTIFGALLSTRVSGDDLIILSGGPGSGKSTLCRLLASELAKNADVHPVFLRLRRFKEGGDLSSFLEDTLENAGVISRISDLQFLPNVVIILDGFDELVMASRARLRQFFRALLDDVHPGPLRKAKVLVSGRDTLFPGGEGLPRGSHVLALLPFDEARVALWGDKWRSLHSSGPGKTFRPEAFVDTDLKHKPPSPLHHLVTWPLTLHLVARTHTAGKLDVSATKQNEIQKAYLYRSILADTSSRQINQTDGKGRLEPSRMREFLRSLAWEMHSRAVDSMDISDVNVLLRAFYTDATDAELSELSDVTVVNQPELQKGQDKGFEFVHKSFAEYLVAELLASSVDAITYRVTEPDGTLGWRQNRREACRSAASLLAPRPVSAEIREMLSPMLGSFAQFVREKRVSETLEQQSRVDGLMRVLDRCQELYTDFFSRRPSLRYRS